MLTVTHAAIELIHDLKSHPGVTNDMGLRIAPRKPGAAKLAVTFAAKPRQGDQVIEAEDVHVYLHRDAASILDDKVLDARINTQGEFTFKLDQQNI